MKRIPCEVVLFKTPRGCELAGFWFGPPSPRRIVVLVHGLAGSALGGVERRLAPLLVDKKTAVFSFNNRGHDVVSKLYKDAPRTKKGYTRLLAGAAHEKFVECVDDIQGAINFVRRQGVRDVYLAGHSTGCQKAMYWAYKKKSRGVKGIVLLAPVSDHASALAFNGRAKLACAEKAARTLVRRGRPHGLLPEALWSGDPVDAQRFLSLYTPDSVEEIFTYAQPKKVPRILRGVRAPVFVAWAGEDEYSDRPATQVAAWFEKTLAGRSRRGRHEVRVVPRAGHGFRGAEREVARAIRRWIIGL